jgi:cytochrome d ubiquinol oxidase subunit II
MMSFFADVSQHPVLSLNSLWFLLIGILFTGYVILDGFDLGVGTIHLFAGTDEERRSLINAIGPVWDGNEVWLVVGGGALFGAFPEVYATVLSGFYFAFILLLFGLIFRAISIEFRSKRPELWWRQTWDVCFSIASVTCGFLIGVAMGNIVWGIPLNAEHEYTGTFPDLLNPFAILMGITAVALFAMHGSLYIVLKTESLLQERARRWARNATLFFVVTYVLTSIATLRFVPRMEQPFTNHPLLFILPVGNVLAIAGIFRALNHMREFQAFLYSCLSIIALMALFGVGMYPDLIVSQGDINNSLNICNSASTQKGLTIMTIMACIGVPLVLTYSCWVYWVFRGKVKTESMHY